MNNMIESQIIRRGITDSTVINAMKSVDRSIFVRDTEKEYSYDDSPLPIGYGQTISQPYIVAYMTEILQIKNDHKILEIGTGSGYQTAILATIASEVFTIEAIEELSLKASITLKTAGFHNICTKCSDGYNGWIENAPYDSIIVTAAAPKIPNPLIEQLKDPGRMIIPVGKQYSTQHMILVNKSKGIITEKKLIPVRFVPFISQSNFL